jgi:hypothetical protein
MAVLGGRGLQGCASKATFYEYIKSLPKLGTPPPCDLVRLPDSLIGKWKIGSSAKAAGMDACHAPVTDQRMVNIERLPTENAANMQTMHSPSTYSAHGQSREVPDLPASEHPNQSDIGSKGFFSV